MEVVLYMHQAGQVMGRIVAELAGPQARRGGEEGEERGARLTREHTR
jgi:hypothetical protein